MENTKPVPLMDPKSFPREGWVKDGTKKEMEDLGYYLSNKFSSSYHKAGLNGYAWNAHSFWAVGTWSSKTPFTLSDIKYFMPVWCTGYVELTKDAYVFKTGDIAIVMQPGTHDSIVQVYIPNRQLESTLKPTGPVLMSGLKPSTKEAYHKQHAMEKAEFKEGDYIVLLKSFSRNFKAKYIYKARETCGYMRPELDISRSKTNGYTDFSFKNKDIWRYATSIEKLAYDAEQKPVDITHVFSIGDEVMPLVEDRDTEYSFDKGQRYTVLGYDDRGVTVSNHAVLRPSQLGKWVAPEKELAVSGALSNSSPVKVEVGEVYGFSHSYFSHSSTRPKKETPAYFARISQVEPIIRAEYYCTIPGLKADRMNDSYSFFSAEAYEAHKVNASDLSKFLALEASYLELEANTLEKGDPPVLKNLEYVKMPIVDKYLNDRNIHELYPITPKDAIGIVEKSSSFDSLEECE